jgi:hypothetical protein
MTLLCQAFRVRLSSFETATPSPGATSEPGAVPRAAGATRPNQKGDKKVKIRSHPESHIVELDDGSRWKIFPGDLDVTLQWKPETDLAVELFEDEVSSHALVNAADKSSVRVIPATEEWPVREVKHVLKEG